MLAFLDFEASSLGKRGFPIEVAWVFEDGREEAHLIRPAPDWEEWDPQAEAIHRIPHASLLADGEPHATVAARMVEALAGHDLLASAPSWDGKWLSALLRAAGLPRHALRLRDTEEAWIEVARRELAGMDDTAARDAAARELIAEVALRDRGTTPAHRALADARAERDRWLAVRNAARIRVRAAVDAGAVSLGTGAGS